MKGGVERLRRAASRLAAAWLALFAAGFAADGLGVGGPVLRGCGAAVAIALSLASVWAAYRLSRLLGDSPAFAGLVSSVAIIGLGVVSLTYLSGRASAVRRARGF